MTGRHRRQGHRRQGKVALAFKNTSGALAGAAVIGSAAAASGTAPALTAALSASHLPAQVILAAAASGAGSVPDTAPDTAPDAARTGTRLDAGHWTTVPQREVQRSGTTLQRHGEAGARVGRAPRTTYRNGPAAANEGKDRSAVLPSRSGSADPAQIVRAFSALHDIPGITPPRSTTSFLQAAPTTSPTAQSTHRTMPQPPPRDRRPRQAGLDEVLRLAEKQVGIREDKSGRNKFTEWYAASLRARETAQRDGGQPSDYRAAAWCDMFVSWVAEQTGAATLGADAYTVKHAKWFQSEHRWGREPRPGALAFSPGSGTAAGAGPRTSTTSAWSPR